MVALDRRAGLRRGSKETKMTEIFTVYADASLSADSFVMSAPLDILASVFNLHDSATRRVLFETSNGGTCTLCSNRGLFLNRFNSVILAKAVR
jgi:enterochelin esterase-like enzyme